MKVALVHELLTTRGGAERVLKILADMFPDAPVYTLLFDERKMSDLFPKERVRGYLAPLFGYNHHLYLKKFPSVVESWDFSTFDLVISSSSAFAHGIITNGRPKHLCYVHSPARYLWDSTHDVLRRAGTGILGPLKRRYLERAFHNLRIWDSEAAERPDLLLANSRTVQRRIELYWRRESEVLYPPVDSFWFEPGEIANRKSQIANPFYLIVSTLSPYKRIDLAIQACNALGRTLIVVGEGRDRRRLERMAGPTVRFLGRRRNEEIRDLYRGAAAVLFPCEDDFGLVPVEAQACSTPVIAYRAGGALETVLEGGTGEFFDEQTPISLQQTLQKFEQKKYSSDACSQNARQFSAERFIEGIHRGMKRLS
jgi:glycosyltransferase involved in cell wall biosynthesis